MRGGLVEEKFGAEYSLRRAEPNPNPIVLPLLLRESTGNSLFTRARGYYLCPKVNGARRSNGRGRIVLICLLYGAEPSEDVWSRS